MENAAIAPRRASDAAGRGIYLAAERHMQELLANFCARYSERSERATARSRALFRSCMTFSGRGVIGLALACGLLLGCVRSSVHRGTELYEQRRYIDAAWVFEGTEPELGRYDVEERVRYGWYRGATLWILGDLDEARRWLEYGSHAARTLPPEQRAALVRGVLGDSPAPTLEQALAAPPPQGAGGGIVAAPALVVDHRGRRPLNVGQ